MIFLSEMNKSQNFDSFLTYNDSLERKNYLKKIVASWYWFDLTVLPFLTYKCPLTLSDLRWTWPQILKK